MLLHRFTKVRAPEFPNDLVWLNSTPLSLQGLRGRPVLVDFWTYSCVNCLRTQPHLSAWYERYAPLGLQMIGIHTPEFAFEKDERHVRNAVARLGVQYPVVLDNDYRVWNLYANRWWPRTFLIDAQGVIVYDHVGEGGYAETEMEIQKALRAIGVKKLPRVVPDMHASSGVCYRTTPETYLGYLRGRMGNKEAFLPDAEEAFTDSGEAADEHVYLHGHWKLTSEYVEHVRALTAPTEYLRFAYSAFGVNVVMAASGKGAEIDVELDGKPLSNDMAGNDVVFVDGRAKVRVREPRMYRVVRAGVYHHGVLRLRTGSVGLRMYAFTFEGCA